MIVRVNLGPRSYDIVISSSPPTPPCEGGARGGGLGPFARQRASGTLALVVSDAHVARHAHAVADELATAGFITHVAVLPPGEEQKALSTAAGLYDRLAELNADRKTLLVAVGGGVIGDLTGFVAATYARGLPLLMVPTTLLAMVDSSVGGKVGVNHPQAKNLIGAFHQPVGVWIDTQTLETLPDREYRSGLAEVVKYGVILDAEFFAFLETQAEAILRREPDAVRHLVARCCRLKADIVEKDEREETGLRMVLNYGHTFAHAFETVSGYGTYLHGEAVAVGMLCASRLAEQQRLIDSELTVRQQTLLERFGLPTAPKAGAIADWLQTMRRDKKALGGRMRLILPKRLGEVALFEDIDEQDVRRVLEEAVGQVFQPEGKRRQAGEPDLR